MDLKDFNFGQILTDKVRFRPGQKGLDGFIVIGRGRRSTSATLVPSRPWQPWEETEYEVRLGKKIAEKRNSLGVFLVSAVDAGRDEAVHATKKEKEKKEAEAARIEAEAAVMRAQNLYPKITAAATRLRALLSQKAQMFLGLEAFDLEQKLKDKSFSVWGEKSVLNKIAQADALTSAFSEKLNETLKNASEMAKKVVEIQLAEFHRFWEERGQLDKKMVPLFNDSDKYIAKITVGGREISVNRDFENYVPVYGRHTDSWSESPDGYRPAGSHTYIGTKDMWVPIEDPAVLAAAAVHFGYELPELRKEEGVLKMKCDLLEKEINQKKDDAWLSAINASDDSRIIETARRVEAWRFMSV